MSLILLVLYEKWIWRIFIAIYGILNWTHIPRKPSKTEQKIKMTVINIGK